jgi:hypothetical protein
MQGPVHPFVARYSEKVGAFRLLPDGFVIAKPDFNISIPFYSKKRGTECVASETLHFRSLTAQEAIEVAQSIAESDLPENYVDGDYQIMNLQRANVNMRAQPKS